MCLLRDYEIIDKILALEGDVNKNDSDKKLTSEDEITAWFYDYLDLMSRSCLFTHRAQGTALFFALANRVFSCLRVPDRQHSANVVQGSEGQLQIRLEQSCLQQTCVWKL